MQPKIILIFSIIVVGALFILWDMIGAPFTMQTKNPQIINVTITPKPFTFTTLDGKTIRSEDLKGKVVVLNFWASWCVPCTVEFPDLINLTKEYPNDVTFLAISVDETHDNARRFVARFEDKPQSNRIIGLDPDRSIAQDTLRTTKYPETYILDRGFIVRHHIIGVIDWSSSEIKADIEKLIAQASENK